MPVSGINCRTLGPCTLSKCKASSQRLYKPSKAYCADGPAAKSRAAACKSAVPTNELIPAMTRHPWYCHPPFCTGAAAGGKKLCYNVATRVQALVPDTVECMSESVLQIGNSSSNGSGFMEHFPHPPVSVALM